jgi:hypothetical protein
MRIRSPDSTRTMGGDAVTAGSNNPVPDRVFASGAVFEIDQDPVGSGCRADLGRCGR